MPAATVASYRLRDRTHVCVVSAGPAVPASAQVGQCGEALHITSMAMMYSATRLRMQLTNVAPGHLKLQKLTVHVLPRVAAWALTIQAQVACRASWPRDQLRPWEWHGARVFQAVALCKPVQSSGQPNRHAAPRQTVMVQPPTRTWLLPHPGNELAMGTPCRQQGSLSQARRATGIASAGNRARVTSMATLYSATRPLMRLPILPPGIRSCRRQLRTFCHGWQRGP